MKREIIVVKAKDKALIKNKQNSPPKDKIKIVRPQETIFAIDVHIFTKENNERQLVTKEQVIKQLFGGNQHQI